MKFSMRMSIGSKLDDWFVQNKEVKRCGANYITALMLAGYKVVKKPANNPLIKCGKLNNGERQMTKYKVNKMWKHTTTVQEFEVDSETEKSVRLGCRNERKNTECHQWVDEKGVALDVAIARQDRIIDGLESDLARAKECRINLVIKRSDK